jgi:hypothetical protein
MRQGIFAQSWLPEGFGANVPEATATRRVTAAPAQPSVELGQCTSLVLAICADMAHFLIRSGPSGYYIDALAAARLADLETAGRRKPPSASGQFGRLKNCVSNGVLGRVRRGLCPMHIGGKWGDVQPVVQNVVNYLHYVEQYALNEADEEFARKHLTRPAVSTARVRSAAGLGATLVLSSCSSPDVGEFSAWVISSPPTVTLGLLVRWIDFLVLLESQCGRRRGASAAFYSLTSAILSAAASIGVVSRTIQGLPLQYRHPAGGILNLAAYAHHYGAKATRRYLMVDPFYAEYRRGRKYA